MFVSPSIKDGMANSAYKVISNLSFFVFVFQPSIYHTSMYSDTCVYNFISRISMDAFALEIQDMAGMTSKR